MVHPVNSPLLIGAFVLFLAFILAIGLLLSNRRKRAAEFRNYFCCGFERDFFPSSAFGEDESFGANHPGYAPIRISSFTDNERGARFSSTSHHEFE